MQIQTNPFRMKRDEYFRILVRNYFRRRLWFYILIYSFTALLVGLHVATKTEFQPGFLFFIIFLLLLPFFILYGFGAIREVRKMKSFTGSVFLR